ncbi:GAF domain-containing protein [Halobacterium litoreum]|uniref:histidine kinase n=1 Tax=Halobacterium litoreum TaxID=2039234 RepID=A0ABD5N9L1_9EURY|nr:GAF domain-containing protein [Halobacterium litoreum]UHH12055.1 PAS domain S-box protein [Halobacterium litoreum]
MTSEFADTRSELLAYATAVASADDVETVYDEMAAAASSVFDFSSAAVEAADDGVLSVRSWSGRPPGVDGIDTDEGIAGRTYQTGETVRVPDVRSDDRVTDPPEGAPRCVISVPIGDVGVFQVGRDEPRAFDDEDVEIAELLASHAGHAIERIRSQRELRESEQRFRALFEEADDAFLLYDTPFGRPGTVEHANGAAERLFDATEAELRERSLDELLAGDPEQFVPGGAESTFQTAPATGDDRVFEVAVKPFFDGGGPDAFAVVSDVTEQHHREQTLTHLHDATRRMLAANSTEEIADVIVDAAKELLGLPYVGVYFDGGDATLRPASVSGPVGDEGPPVLRRGASLAWQVYEAGVPRMFEDVASRDHVHNEDTIVVEEFIHPLGEHGVLLVGAEEVGVLTKTDRDLLSVLATNGEAALDRAERVRMLRDREAELRRERNRLAALFENIPSPTASFVVEHGEPVVKSVNPAFERVFGYDEETLVGENIDDYIVPADHQTEAEVYNEKLMAGQNVNVEVRRVTEDGPKDFLLDVVPFRLDEPNVHGYAMYTDITDRKERERELERQNDRLEEFAGIVSHDLRNPLNVARGYLELAAETESEEHFERADDALERMHDIIESVLTLARHGRSLEETVDVSLENAVDRAWKNVTTAEADVTVTADATLAADPSRLGSLLENLFRNAVEHGGDAVRVTVGPIDGDGGDLAGFYVADDGPGIPPDHREEVFRSGKTHSEDGTGFGLAIVKSVADAHGWRVELAESENGGARFEFYTDESTA